MSTGKRSKESSAADRISSLDCHLLEKILGYLPLHDAVRTSVLSRVWRYKWVVCSKLVFDDYVDKGLLLRTIIYEVLLVHPGPELSLGFLTSKDFRISSHLFKFQDLRHLELYRCKFHPPPSFKGFNRLVTLSFRFVIIETMSFQTLLLSSPLLEHVTLLFCTGFDRLTIEAPSLKFFEFIGTANSICFRRTPLLEEIILGIHCNKMESFTVANPQLTLQNIKILKFTSLFFTKVERVAYALYLINHCPNLERLLIKSYTFEECVIHPLQSQVMIMTQCALKRLKCVNMSLNLGNEAEMEFLKNVLSSATALEKICIVTSAEFSRKGMKVMEEMKQFPRASPNVEFIYKVVDIQFGRLTWTTISI